MNHERARALLARRFDDGALAPLEEQALRAHLRGCPPCRALFDQYADAEAGLEGTPGRPSEAQLARMRDSVPPPARARRGALIVAAATVAAAALGGFLLLRSSGPDFTARGNGPGADVGLRVFTERSGKTAPAEAGVRVGDGLLFAYSMEKGAPHRYLAVVARDAKGAVHWFHPGYETPEDTPQSVSVQAGVADQPLPDSVYVDMAPGPMEICGLFTRDPLDVRSLDAWLTANRGAWPQHAQACVKVEVQP